MIKFPSNQICFFFLICKKSRILCMQKRYARLRVSLNIADLADDVTRGHDEERNGEVIPG